MENIKQVIANNLLQIKAIKLSPQSPFTWASGIKSPIYCDNRITLSFPEVRNIIKIGFSQLSDKFDSFDHVTGVATAGIAHGALLADHLDLPFSYVRASAKAHGRQNKIEGYIAEGSRIMVIEDLISTGGSSIEAVEVLRNEGYEVVGVMAIFSYQFEKAKENFNNAKIKFATLSDYFNLVNEAHKIGFLTENDRKTLEKWSANPEQWYDQNF